MVRYKYDNVELLEIVRKTIEEKKTHKDYDHVVEYAEWCKQQVTGDDQKEIVIKYKPSESQKQQQQRIRLYNSRTQFVSNQIVNQFKIIERTDNVTDTMVYEKANDINKQYISEIDERLSCFYELKHAKKYLNETHRHLVFHDPNSFLVVEAMEFDRETEKPYTYPLEVSAKEAINFEYINGILQYLIIRQDIEIFEPEEQPGSIVQPKKSQKLTKRIGHKFTLYGPDVAYVYQEVEQKGVPNLPGEDFELIVLRIDDKDVKFAFAAYETFTKEVPAVRVGYIKDARTDRRTCVSPLYPADKIYKDLIVNKSEYDLHKALHGFLQKYAYAKNCDYRHEDDICRFGNLMDGSKCPKCKGEGILIHKSVQDVILIRKPEDREEHIPLSEYIHYVEIPQHITESYKNDIKDLERDVSMAIFNSNVFDRSEIQVAVTATEKILNRESEQNQYSDYGDNWSRIYKFIVMQTAIQLEVDEGLHVEHKFPYDFKLESIDELIGRRKRLIEANAPYQEIIDVDKKILSKQNRDSPELVDVVMTREKFKPFREKTESERSFILGYLPEEDYDRVLYIYHEKIFTEIENDPDQKDFYSLPYQKQKEIVDTYVNEIITEIEERKKRNTPNQLREFLNNTTSDPDPEPDEDDQDV